VNLETEIEMKAAVCLW